MKVHLDDVVGVLHDKAHDEPPNRLQRHHGPRPGAEAVEHAVAVDPIPTQTEHLRKPAGISP